MAKVYRYIQEGWPEQANDPALKPYWTRRLELSTLDGCIVWGSRVVIPPQVREILLTELHSGHPGCTRMKSVARGLLWWPCLHRDIEMTVKQCVSCQQGPPQPPSAPLQPWTWPTRPWSRLHIDFAGPVAGKMFLVVVDAHSKWIEVAPMATATSLTTIQQLRQMFVHFGIPDAIVSDNGPQFASSEFTEFCRSNGIRHVLVAPYHPASNGLAERAVKILKQGLKKMTDCTVTDRIARFLFQYRNTPHSTTGMIPAELLMGWKLRSRLDLVKPNLRYVQDKQGRQKRQHDLHAKQRTFVEGERVFVKNHSSGDPWLPGEISKATGPVSYTIKLAGGSVVRSHQDHLRRRLAEDQPPDTQPSEDTDDLASQFSEDLNLPEQNVPSPDSGEPVTESTEPEQVRAPPPPSPSTASEQTAGSLPTSADPGRHHKKHSQPSRVYPQRDRHVPQYYGT